MGTVREQDLMDIGVKKKGHRKKILLFINKEKQRNNNNAGNGGNQINAAYHKNLNNIDYDNKDNELDPISINNNNDNISALKDSPLYQKDKSMDVLLNKNAEKNAVKKWLTNVVKLPEYI